MSENTGEITSNQPTSERIGQIRNKAIQGIKSENQTLQKMGIDPNVVPNQYKRRKAFESIRKEQFADQAAIRAMNAEVRAQKAEADAAIDPLTNLLRRKPFLAEVNREIALINREGNTLQRGASVILTDIDDYGLFNKTNGMQVGDKVLGEVASQFDESTRETDILARWGGEEFVGVLPYSATDKTSYEDDVHPAERIRKDIANRAIDGKYHVTVSVGTTDIEIGESFEDTFNRSDLALRFAKMLGKNRAIHIEKPNGSNPLYVIDLTGKRNYTYSKEATGEEYLYDEKDKLRYIISEDENKKPKLVLVS